MRCRSRWEQAEATTRPWLCWSTSTYCSSCSPRWLRASCSMNNYEKAAAAAVGLMLLAAGAIFFYAPADALQHGPQRVFYLHGSSALAAYGGSSALPRGGSSAQRTEDLSAP